jgi:hypothetical protein
MKKYQISPELRIKNYGDKVFLYNPWSDNIFEVSRLSWKVALRISKGKTPQSLALELRGKIQKNYSTTLKEIKKLQKELIKWKILITH